MFSFVANGATKEDALALLAAEDAINPDLPDSFVAAVKEGIESLPDSAHITLECSGKTDWPDDQTIFEISLHFAAQIIVLPDDDADVG